MTIRARPSRTSSMLGGVFAAIPNTCGHAFPARRVRPWVGERGTTGTVAVVGAGKMGLPLAAQFASHGWRVVAVDIVPAVVESINSGRSHLGAEPGLASLIGEARAGGLLEATTEGREAAREADVVVLIVPVILNESSDPDYSAMDEAVASIAADLQPGTTVIFETTLALGDTRMRYLPRLLGTGLRPEEDLFVAFSPERLFSGAVLANLATYPKLVGGIGAASTDRAARFYESVLDTEVVAMSSAEAAEMSKLAETTYRDVNIALANEFAAYADHFRLDIREVIDAANSQPYSHIHQPGLGVGGHCIPVYPHLLMSRGPALRLPALARAINDGQVAVVIRWLEEDFGSLMGVPVLVLGLTYRAGVKELAYSNGVALIEGLRRAGADVWAFDPLLSQSEITALGARPYRWGEPSNARALITQTADARWDELDLSNFDQLHSVVDGRNSLTALPLRPGSSYRGIGVPRREA